MRYVSTRGQAPELTFEEAMLTGLARDGGLYVPAEVPQMAPPTSPRWRGSLRGGRVPRDAALHRRGLHR
jgi:threonine synthase